MGLIKFGEYLLPDQIYHGDSRVLLRKIEPESIALSIWSPPYYVGKNYEKDLSFDEWKNLLREVVNLHYSLLKPGGFLAINIADILCFKDVSMPKIMAENISRRKIGITRSQIMGVMKQHPEWNRYQLTAHLGCSEQTVDRRLNGNNIRGGNIRHRPGCLLSVE
jgi:site-specific DNA-methyltransferase (adenine-specific)